MNKKLLGVLLVAGATAAWTQRDKIKPAAAWVQNKAEEGLGWLMTVGLPHVSVPDPSPEDVVNANVAEFQDLLARASEREYNLGTQSNTK